ncbi:MAG: transketolase [Spirochaetes bacterium]|nr:transketolase [Spirochaetota bacterium]
MGIFNSKSGQDNQLNKEQLIAAAKNMRALNLISIHAARSGHPGGTLSIMDIAAALFLNEAKLDPEVPDWSGRDRIFFSAGHKAPAIYVSLCEAGFFPPEKVATLRKLNSPFQGHPHAPKLSGIEVSSGSLGQGLSIAVGTAIHAQKSNADYRTYCIMGDGEQQEGSIWEAVMTAAHYKLDNLCAIVDKNCLQIDGFVEDVMDIDPISEKYRAFGWNVIEIDGHNMDDILAGFEKARTTKGKPTVLIACTVKGKGVSFMENIAGWHGVATKDEEQLKQALNEIDSSKYDWDKTQQLLKGAREYHEKQLAELKKELPSFSKNYWWNETDKMKVKMEPTRFGFGRCLEKNGDDPRLMTIKSDISGSIKILDFEKEYPERKDRAISVGIAEQNMMTVAAGLALEGKIPITGTYGVFSSGRPWDQIRTTICYDSLNVKIAGAHGGVSVGADGATHQALEEISIMNILPNMQLVVPSDSVETERLCKTSFLDINGPVYVRFAREATPAITDETTPLQYGKANVIRFRGVKENFAQAFETVLAKDHKNEAEDLTLIACGPIVTEAMRAAWILKEEYSLETRVLNIHTVKPLDQEAIIAAANDTGAVITCEEHQMGGFGGIVSNVINQKRSYQQPFVFDMIGVEDRFGESGGPWELMIRFKLTAEHIAEKAKALMGRKK